MNASALVVRKGHRVPYGCPLAMKYERRGDAECWPWRGALMTHGYGSVRVDGVARCAHLVVYESLYEELGLPAPPPGMEFHHTCDTNPCVNPFHCQWVAPTPHRAEGGRKAHRKVAR